ncbi:MAG: ankyrin repeat and protein mask isoform, partial [Chlamydiales bacterium]|nr:ankyrin repeat and protein mask isoform [Chlamydiales bacterium]
TFIPPVQFPNLKEGDFQTLKKSAKKTSWQSPDYSHQLTENSLRASFNQSMRTSHLGHIYQETTDINSREAKFRFLSSCRNGLAEEITALIELGIEVDIKDSEMSHLRFTLRSRELSAFEALLEGLENRGMTIEEIEKREGQPLIGLAIAQLKDKSIPFIKLLLEKKASKAPLEHGYQLLSNSLESKSVDLFKFLYSHCSHREAPQGKPSLLQIAFEKNQLEEVKFLLSQGLDPYVKDMQGNNLLHLAVKKGDEKRIEMLLNLEKENGFSLSLEQNLEGQCPFHLAIGRGLAAEVLDALMANPSFLYWKGTDYRSMNLLFVAISQGSLSDASYLISKDLAFAEKGLQKFSLTAPISSSNDYSQHSAMALIHALSGQDLELIEKIARHTEDAFKGTLDNRSIMSAAAERNLPAFKLMLEIGAHVNKEDLLEALINNFTPSWKNPVTPEQAANYADFLLNRTMNSIDDPVFSQYKEQTLLMEAVISNQLKLAAYALQKGASLEIKNESGKTALDLAARNPAMLRLITQAQDALRKE